MSRLETAAGGSPSRGAGSATSRSPSSSPSPAACLSAWQLARSKEAAAANALIAAELRLAAGPAHRRTADARRRSRRTRSGRASRVTGTYERDQELLVRNRPFNGSPGFEVLTPLRTADGSLFIVDRGWVPTGNTDGRARPRARRPGGDRHRRRAAQGQRAGHPGRTGDRRSGRHHPALGRQAEARTAPTSTRARTGCSTRRSRRPATAPTPTVTDSPDAGRGTALVVHDPVDHLRADRLLRSRLRAASPSTASSTRTTRRSRRAPPSASAAGRSSAPTPTSRTTCSTPPADRECAPCAARVLVFCRSCSTVQEVRPMYAASSVGAPCSPRSRG